MATASTPSINHALTSLTGITGGGGSVTTDLFTVGDGAPSATVSDLSPNPSQFSPAGLESSTTQIAVLPQSDTTLTAYAVPGTTGLAVLNGQTLTFRGEGVTLSDGNVVSLGFDGLVESTATATYQPLTGGDVSAMLTSSFYLPTGPGPVILNSSLPAAETTSSGAGLTSGQATLTTSQSQAASGSSAASTTTDAGESSAAGASGSDATQASASASPSESADAAASLSAGKAAILLGAVGGLALAGL